MTTKLEYEKSQVYLRDKFIKFDDANLSIASSPVLYGLAIYTVFTASWNDQTKKLYIFRLQDHYNRLIRSSKVLSFNDFESNWSYAKFEAMIMKLLKINDACEDVLVRASVFADGVNSGAKTHGVVSALSAYICPFGEILPSAGISAGVSSWRRNPDNSIPANLKANGGYVNSALMKNEALANGYNEAIALNSRGQVSEGTIANIFLVKDGQLITPDVSSDILVGITRESILSLAKSLDIECVERPVERQELYESDEAFFCGSSANVAPILSIDKHVVGKGDVGLLTQKLSQAYAKSKNGGNQKFSAWLTEAKV